MKKTVNVLNLGCARNLVDSQSILGNLKRKGYSASDLEDAETVIVNTCGFIEDAKKESVEAILELIDLKKEGKIKKIIVAGCLSQRYSNELLEEFKGDVDAIIGAQKLDSKAVEPEVSLTPKHFAYIKICESCYNNCKFCTIPMIKGKFISRTMESIIEQVKELDKSGVCELNIIGQDITAYGMDIYKKPSLSELLKKIAKETKNIKWIRLLYTFPAHITDELIDTIAEEDKICKYIDIPLQHINDNILTAMNRKITKQQTIDLIKKIRERIPFARLRTTMIVGLPGEGEDEFSELLSFTQDMKFERLGAFMYSREEGTASYDMANQVSKETKQVRYNELMELQ
ncbi:MAG: 30S ribosomal protein S12 methylthiotransferase RimO, partial [Candidatus Zapsychrus exili]|nr:30S ribosomal protein S12 methylthiotransferase RimO [Candidatus Zapsychrus exili]